MPFLIDTKNYTLVVKTKVTWDEHLKEILMTLLFIDLDRNYWNAYLDGDAGDLVEDFMERLIDL
jgi:hypothetical protein